MWSSSGWTPSRAQDRRQDRRTRKGSKRSRRSDGVLDRFGRLPGIRSLPPVLPVSSRRIGPAMGGMGDPAAARSQNTPAVVASVPANAPERNSRPVFARWPGAPDTRDRSAIDHNPAPPRQQHRTALGAVPTAQPIHRYPASPQPRDRCWVKLGRGQRAEGHEPQRRADRGRFSPARASR